MSKKSIDRMKSKKKKAVAFIELIKTDEKYLKSKEEANMKQRESVESNTEDASQPVSSGGKEKSLSDEMFAEYKKIMRERQKASMMKPKVFLTLDELTRDDPTQNDVDTVKVTPPLFMADVQHLLLFGVQGQEASLKPRWCRLLRVGKVGKVVAVVLDSLSSEEFKKYPESLPTLAQAFDLHAEMVSPLQYGSSVREDIMNVPISITQLKKQGVSDEDLSKHKERNRQMVQRRVKSLSNHKASWVTDKVFAENPNTCVSIATAGGKRQLEDGQAEGSNKRPRVDDSAVYDDVVSSHELDKYDRRWLMLNSAQLLIENIPTPVTYAKNKYRGFEFTKSEYKDVTEESPLYAVDCEMVQTTASSMDLARISIVDENLEVVYDSFVKPLAPVTNYVTRFSGITKEILDPVTTRIQDVQRIIQTYLPPDAILVGHSICSDLSSMKMFHPFIIDTSVIYNIAGNRRIKAGLKKLTYTFLGQNIQEGDQGHSSVEDAQATMKLALLKLRNSLEFGDVVMSEIPLNNDTVTPITNDSASIGDSNNGHSTPKTEDFSVTENNDIVEKVSLNNNKHKTEEKSISSGEAKTCDDKTIVKKADSDKVSVGCECGGKTKTVDSDIQKRQLFFRKGGHKFIESFLQSIQKQKRQGAIIDEVASSSLYPESLTITPCKKDKDSERETVARIQTVGFCFTHLYGYRDYIQETKGNSNNDEENLKKCLWKLDRRFWKIMNGLPSNSLFVVILPGREENGQILPAMTFAKIT